MNRISRLLVLLVPFAIAVPAAHAGRLAKTDVKLRKQVKRLAAAPTAKQAKHAQQRRDLEFALGKVVDRAFWGIPVIDLTGNRQEDGSAYVDPPEHTPLRVFDTALGRTNGRLTSGGSKTVALFFARQLVSTARAHFQFRRVEYTEQDVNDLARRALTWADDRRAAILAAPPRTGPVNGKKAMEATIGGQPFLTAIRAQLEYAIANPLSAEETKEVFLKRP
jgi:hypothetical protein